MQGGAMNVDTPTVNCLSLCSGIEGIGLGLRQVIPGFRTVCYVEREIAAVAILAQRMEDKALDDAPVWSDLTTFDGKPWRGVVDIVTGGIPCQPFSYAGKRKGGDDERNLWPEALRIVGEVRPALAFFENVPGVERYYFNQVWPELHGMGYEVAEGIFSAAEVGASHRRERVFILAYHDSFASRTPWTDDGQWRASRTPSGSEQLEGGVLAHARHQQVNVLKRLHGAKPETASGDVGNAESGEQRLQRQREGESQESAGRPGSDVAHAVSPRPQWQGLEARGRAEPARIHSFPPAPDDLEGWSRVLAEMPSLEPAVCRVADELPNRVDRLAALGNAVVPRQAALAFTTLWEKLGR